MIWLSVALAGGGPLSTQVLYDSNSPDSEALALDYVEARQLPESALCAVEGPFEPTLSYEDFDARIRQPWLACRGESTDVLVLMKGLPYRVGLSTFHASVEAVLQVGEGTQGGEPIAGRGQSLSGSTAYASVKNPAVVFAGHYGDDFTLSNPTQSYYTTTSGLTRQAWPVGFERDRSWVWPGIDLTGELMVVSRIDGYSFEDAHALIDRALAAEAQPPTGTWLCMAAADSARGPRDPECEYATRMLAALGVDSTWLNTHDSALTGHTVLAYLTGAANLKGSIDGLDYAPGAYADNITSYGAVPNNFCDPEVEDCSESQTSIARFVRAGASAVHGTVAEPLNNVFPNAGTLLLYSQGYALGESVLYNTRHLYWQNLLLGDPLMTPFDERPTVGWDGWATADHPRGVASVEVYKDGELVTDLPEGEHEVLVVATAKGRTVQVPEFEVGAITIDPQTQGWGWFSVTIEPWSPPDTGDTGDTGGPTPSEDCGCGAPGSAVPLWALVALGVGLRRVRQDGA